MFWPSLTNFYFSSAHPNLLLSIPTLIYSPSHHKLSCLSCTLPHPTLPCLLPPATTTSSASAFTPPPGQHLQRLLWGQWGSAVWLGYQPGQPWPFLPFSPGLPGLTTPPGWLRAGSPSTASTPTWLHLTPLTHTHTHMVGIITWTLDATLQLTLKLHGSFHFCSDMLSLWCCNSIEWVRILTLILYITTMWISLKKK